MHTNIFRESRSPVKGGLFFFAKNIKKVIDFCTEKDYTMFRKLKKHSTKEVQEYEEI